MPEELETILRLVADGRLSPEEAAPIIEAITRAERAQAEAGHDATERLGRHAEQLERGLHRAHMSVDRAIADVNRSLEAAGHQGIGIDLLQTAAVKRRVPLVLDPPTPAIDESR